MGRWHPPLFSQAPHLSTPWPAGGLPDLNLSPTFKRLCFPLLVETYPVIHLLKIFRASTLLMSLRIGSITHGTTLLSFLCKRRDAEWSSRRGTRVFMWVVPHSFWTFVLTGMSFSLSFLPAPFPGCPQSPVLKATLKTSHLPDSRQMALLPFCCLSPECLPSEDRNYSVHSPQASHLPLLHKSNNG